MSSNDSSVLDSMGSMASSLPKLYDCVRATDGAAAESNNTSATQPTVTSPVAGPVNEPGNIQSNCVHLLERKDGAMKNARGKVGPLQLLDLPLDILKDIIKEITHTNDLTSLALTCSALHGLAIPWIYSRFDIVWPDSHSTSDSRQGVDALTHGLATLVMGEVPTYASQPTDKAQNFTCTHCGTVNTVETLAPVLNKTLQPRRRANHYPQYTRKFSLGNGPDEWIKEYLINRESGKMLGTLVALAVARMPSLESFIWDMPTGVLRDCWLALSSLGQCYGSREQRLEKVWIRFHDNKEIITMPEFIPSPLRDGCSKRLPGSLVAERLAWSYAHVEYPNFSILPPLRSLNVLNIDEVAYIDEMSVLVERSMDTLRELRVGIASSVPREDFASITVSAQSFNEDADPSSTYKGALDLLMSKVYEANPWKRGSQGSNRPDTKNLISTVLKSAAASHQTNDETNAPAPSQSDPVPDPAGILGSLAIRPKNSESAMVSEVNGMKPSMDYPSMEVNSPITWLCGEPTERLTPDRLAKQSHAKKNTTSSMDAPSNRNSEPNAQQQRRLRLEVLELEHVNLCVPALLKAMDWSVVTTLTLLHCDSHEQLWKAFRRTFTPRLISAMSPGVPQPLSRRKSQMPLRKGPSSGSRLIPTSEYRLSLRRIQTNTVSPALIWFLKETLAPNSLEWLFLQDGGNVLFEQHGERGPYNSQVTVDSILKGPLRRHRSSLKKLLIDSTSSLSSTASWRKWLPDRDVLLYIVSGKMSALRELAICIDHKDWVSSYRSLLHWKSEINPVTAFLPATDPSGATPPLPVYPAHCEPIPPYRRKRISTADHGRCRTSARRRALLPGDREEVF